MRMLLDTGYTRSYACAHSQAYHVVSCALVPVDPCSYITRFTKYNAVLACQQAPCACVFSNPESNWQVSRRTGLFDFSYVLRARRRQPEETRRTNHIQTHKRRPGPNKKPPGTTNSATPRKRVMLSWQGDAVGTHGHKLDRVTWCCKRVFQELYTTPRD